MNRLERDRIIEQMARTGLTYEAIGQQFGLSRERVRQLLKLVGIDGATMREIRLTSKQVALQNDQDRIRAWVKHNPGLCVPDAEEALGLHPGRVREALGDEVTRLFTFSPRHHQVRYTDADILGTLRDAADIQGDPLTGNAYDEYVAVFGGPSRARIMQRYGTWKAACSAAGLSISDYVGNTHRRWSRAQLIEAVIEYIHSPGARGSVDDYDRWAAEDKPARPGSGTIRNRFGSWTAAKRAALSASARGFAA